MKKPGTPPYKVKYKEHDFFQDYSDVGPYKSIRPGSKAGDPTVTNLHAIKYMPNGDVLYKLDDGTDEWSPLMKPRVSDEREPRTLYQMNESLGHCMLKS